MRRQLVPAVAFVEITDSTTTPRRSGPVSTRGARLAIGDASQVEDSFTLLLSTNGEPSRRCHVIWRQGNEIGVRFI